jgi:hypothetical protein
MSSDSDILYSKRLKNGDVVSLFGNGIVSYLYNYENGDDECINIDLRECAERAILDRNDWASIPHRNLKNASKDL